jgi:hypothetical protein
VRHQRSVSESTSTAEGDLLIGDLVRREQQPTGLNDCAMRQRCRLPQTDQLYPLFNAHRQRGAASNGKPVLPY